jgi:sorbitol/mannitol transport system permease protein
MTAISPTSPVALSVNRRARREGWLRRGPLLPALVFGIIVTQLPFIATFVFSFRRWNTNHPDRYGWAGLTNYKTVFSDSRILRDIWNTVQLTVVVVLVSLALGLGIALLLNRRFAGRAVVRTFMIAPFLIVPVAAALFWKFGMFDPNTGFLNGFVTFVRRIFAPGSTATAADILGQHPMLSVEIELIWQWTPFMTLILLAGLQSRPGEVLEAAAVDGATGWQIFVHMTMPHMRQYLELAGLLGAIYILQNFDSVYALTPQNLGTENLPNLIYQTIYSSNDYGLASAQGVIIVIGTILVATFALKTVFSLFREEASR